MEAGTKFNDVEGYIAAQPPSVQAGLLQLRNTIKKAAPAAEELISYSMPAFKLQGILVWYAAHKEHFGFYPRAEVIEVFKKELSDYTTAKGTIQFPFDKPLPLRLITKIVKYRVAENLESAKRKAAKKGK